ncbi:hypothetical protein A6A06_14015 [Streptomyces sp. CB02923]|nr:hypothetical protein A6A06_14015 [Streptomyces sp. CB02923]
MPPKARTVDLLGITEQGEAVAAGERPQAVCQVERVHAVPRDRGQIFAFACFVEKGEVRCDSVVRDQHVRGGAELTDALQCRTGHQGPGLLLLPESLVVNGPVIVGQGQEDLQRRLFLDPGCIRSRPYGTDLEDAAVHIRGRGCRAHHTLGVYGDGTYAAPGIGFSAPGRCLLKSRALPGEQQAVTLV